MAGSPKARKNHPSNPPPKSKSQALFLPPNPRKPQPPSRPCVPWARSTKLSRKKIETTHKPTIQRLESQIAELKKAAASPELTEQVNQWKARAEAAEKKIETVNFTQSQKYQDQYQKPYVEQWNRAVAQFQQLNVKVQKGVDDLGDPVFEVRPANEHDLLRLANLPLSEMDEEVSRVFGASGTPSPSAH